LCNKLLKYTYNNNMVVEELKKWKPQLK